MQFVSSSIKNATSDDEVIAVSVDHWNRNVQCAMGSTSECSGALSANYTDDDFTVVESQQLRRKNPMWERSGLMLVGYKQNGLQIRLAWFKHARQVLSKCCTILYYSVVSLVYVCISINE